MKRIMDLFISFILLTLFSPLIILIAITVRVSMGAPILFKQQRPGLYGKPFYLYKFRTMTNRTDNKGSLLSDKIRLTPLGRILRKYSMDELPQLVNVLKGDMSLVGPRPLLMEYLPLYNQRQRRRQHVLPGITGWAQVNGRNALDWDEKFELDVWYVDNQCFRLDFKILWMSLAKVLKKEGISHQNSVTMEKFNGNQEVL